MSRGSTPNWWKPISRSRDAMNLARESVNQTWSIRGRKNESFTVCVDVAEVDAHLNRAVFLERDDSSWGIGTSTWVGWGDRADRHQALDFLFQIPAPSEVDCAQLLPERARFFSFDCVDDDWSVAEVRRRCGKSVEVLSDDLDQVLTEVVGNGKSGNFEINQNTLKFSGFIWLV